MLIDYLVLGDVEITNSARIRAYLESLGSPIDILGCFCPQFTNETVGDGPYTTPDSATEPAPWYDPDVPESAQFIGAMLLSIEGDENNPYTREVTRSAQGAGALGPAREQPAELTLTFLVIGATCCARVYGGKWLAQALAGCTGTSCGGDCAEVLLCCPATPAELEEQRRTYRRVALTSGPTLLSVDGDGVCGGTGCDGSNGEVATYEAVITAATPWQWTDLTQHLAVDLPTDDGSCTTWCIGGSEADRVCAELTEGCGPGTIAAEAIDGPCPPGSLAWPDRESLDLECDTPCRLRECTSTDDACSNPRCTSASPPVATSSETCFCEPLAVNQEYYEIDLTTQPRWFGSVPVIEVYAGSTELRNVQIKFFQRTASHLGMTCEQVAMASRCNPFAVFNVSYVPAFGTVTIDGQVGRAFVDCNGACLPSGDTHGANGGPLLTPLFECDKYCVEVTADAWNLPAEDSQLTISTSGRTY